MLYQKIRDILVAFMLSQTQWSSPILVFCVDVCLVCEEKFDDVFVATLCSQM